MQNHHLSKSIIDILSIARLAPSVHNTQPWRVQAGQDELAIFPSSDLALVHGDPTGRQKVISIGIFTEACVIALAHCGFIAGKIDYQNDGKVLISVNSGANKSQKVIDADVRALKRRFTDRAVYQKTNVTKAQLESIESSWKPNGAKVTATADAGLIRLCAQLTRQGLSIALGSPDFRKELASYLVPSQKTPYGIPVTTLKSGGVQSRLMKKILAFDRVQSQEAKREYERWLSASGVVFVLAKGDSPAFWLESGRAYLRAALAIQKLGFHQATSAAVVEASDFHEDIEKALGTKMRLQCLIRFGASKSKYRYSGRFKPQDLLIT